MPLSETLCGNNLGFLIPVFTDDRTKIDRQKIIMIRAIILMVAGVLLTSCGDSKITQGVGSDVKNSASTQSPNGDIVLSVNLTAEGEAQYSVGYKGKAIVSSSKLGFDLDGQEDLLSGFQLVDVALSQFDETWEQPWGEERYIRNNYSELKIFLKETENLQRELNITFRVFDDGIGFRYEIPKQDHLKEMVILDELTEFSFAGDHSAWWTPGMAGNQYEYLYENTPLSEMPKAHTPVTMESESGTFIVLHEAALHDYSTMNVERVEDSGATVLRSALVPIKKDSPLKAKVTAPFNTPWRTLQIADSELDLITSYLTLNLNEPNALGDVSWVSPGKYVGIWWELHLEKTSWASGEKHGATTENTRKYIDFAAKHGFDGVLVEGWNVSWDGEWWNMGGHEFKFDQPYPDFDVESLSKYAAEKGVYIIGHHETGADTDNYEAQLDAAYDFLEKYGMKAVKTGYVETGELLANGDYHHGQNYVEHVDRVTKIAAEHKVMVVAHETIKDTGERRTYPNLISREVARGQEYDAWSEDGGNPPSHTAIIPFTRMLTGPMDFTPGAFELTLPTRPNNQVNTTLAKQLALYVVIYSPVQMASDLPEHYEEKLDAFQFIKDVAVDWETTKVLGGKIGEFVSIARKERDGDRWFIGSLTNEKPRDVSLNLSFLDDDKRYTATLYRDGDGAHYHDNPASYVIETKTVSKQDSLTIPLAAGGGVAISLVPVP